MQNLHGKNIYCYYLSVNKWKVFFQKTLMIKNIFFIGVCETRLFVRVLRAQRKSRMRRSIYSHSQGVWNSYFAHTKQKRRVSHTPLKKLSSIHVSEEGDNSLASLGRQTTPVWPSSTSHTCIENNYFHTPCAKCPLSKKIVFDTRVRKWFYPRLARAQTSPGG